MDYVVQPQLQREVVRAFDFKSRSGAQQHDYSLARHYVEIPLGKARLREVGAKDKTVRMAKAGDLVVIETDLESPVKNRVLHVEVHPLLYRHGVPSFKRIYSHGETAFEAVRWECAEDLDLAKVKWLYEVYLLNLHVR